LFKTITFDFAHRPSLLKPSHFINWLCFRFQVCRKGKKTRVIDPSVQLLSNHGPFVVLTAIVMENSIFYDTPPCSPLKINLFTEDILANSALLSCGFLLGLFFNSEDGADMLLRNVN
jgi:hypothetical protein